MKSFKVNYNPFTRNALNLNQGYRALLCPRGEGKVDVIMFGKLGEIFKSYKLWKASGKNVYIVSYNNMAYQP